jgi:Carbohydrate-selective porin, OprB family
MRSNPEGPRCLAGLPLVSEASSSTWAAYGRWPGHSCSRRAPGRRDFSELIQPPGSTLGTKRGSYYVAASFQQYLVQDPGNPTRGWGVFGEIGTGDGNPNVVEWDAYLGVGGSSLIPGRPDDSFGVAVFQLQPQPRSQERGGAGVQPSRRVGRRAFLQCGRGAMVPDHRQSAVHQTCVGRFSRRDLRGAEHIHPVLV